MRFSRKSCCQREASSIAKALIKWNSLPVTLMNSAQPADSKNAMEYLSSLQHGAETFQNSRKDPTIFLKISKTCINFMAWFRGVVYHLPWHMIHNIKPTDHGSYHVKGFWDCPMYSWNRWVLEMSTWVETPCRLHSTVQLELRSTQAGQGRTATGQQGQTPWSASWTSAYVCATFK